MPRLTNLKKYIVQSRIFQVDLAYAIGVGESRMSRIVNGRVAPSDREAAALAKELRLTEKRVRELASEEVGL
jgi:plasmid maintenance system antidote protein VapI